MNSGCRWLFQDCWSLVRWLGGDGRWAVWAASVSFWVFSEGEVSTAAADLATAGTPKAGGIELVASCV